MAMPSGLAAVCDQQVLDQAELDVELLQLRRFGDEHIHLDVVADRHLVEKAAKLGLHQRKSLSQTLALGDKL
jgi:hypothetical protein